MNGAPGLRWVAILGGAGFAAGFFGPLIFVPEANQGPLVGLLISGPLGAVLGLALYGICALFKIPERTQWRILSITASLGILVILVCVQPSPARLGTLYVVEVTSCTSPTDVEEKAVAYWEKRIVEVTWAEPRPNWRQDMHATLREAPGVVVELQTTRGNSVFENRKPWNRGLLFDSGWKDEVAERSIYRPDATCDEFPRKLEMVVFESYELSGKIEPPKLWPPAELAQIAGVSAFSPVPKRFERFLAGK
jgi:hypothetical protein